MGRFVVTEKVGGAGFPPFQTSLAQQLVLHDGGRQGSLAIGQTKTACTSPVLSLPHYIIQLLPVFCASIAGRYLSQTRTHNPIAKVPCNLEETKQKALRIL